MVVFNELGGSVFENPRVKLGTQKRTKRTKRTNWGKK